MIAIVLSILTVFTILYLSSSTDLLDPSIPKVVFRILLKYCGFAAPLKCDSTGTFNFSKVALEGDLTISEHDIVTFTKAVDSAAARETFLLTAKTTPLVIAILADSRCPIKPLGAVNTRNSISQARFDLDRPMRYVAEFGTIPGKRRKRGVEFAITIDVYQGGRKVMHNVLWFLQFLPKTYKPVAVEEPAHTMDTGEMMSSLHLTKRHPHLWAASCKDYNPIHISSIAAQLFGFKSTIAHGNHVAALLVAGLGITLEQIELEFLRPMFLPGDYDITKSGDVYTVGKHMRMTISALPR